MLTIKNTQVFEENFSFVLRNQSWKTLLTRYNTPYLFIVYQKRMPTLLDSCKYTNENTRLIVSQIFIL